MTTVAPAPSAPDPGPRRLTIEEFERIPDDLFPESERAELIDGLIYTRMGGNDPHYFTLLYALRTVQALFAPEYLVVPQMPTRFVGGSKVEPDIMVLKGRVEDYEGRRVKPSEDVTLLVEVSDSTLLRDQTLKAELYAKQGVPEYWIVNLPSRTLEVRRLPRPEGYAEIRIYAEGESVSMNGGEIVVADLLPKAA